MFYLGIILLPISTTLSGIIFLFFLFNKKIYKFDGNLSLYHKLFLIFIVYNLLIGIFSVNLMYHYVGFIGHYLIYILFYKILLENNFSSEKIINSAITSGIILSLISYITFLGFKFDLKFIKLPYLQNEYLINMSSLELENKASGLNMNPNILAIYLVLTLILSIKKNNFVILIVQLIGIILSGSRGALLSLVLPIIYYIFEYRKYFLLTILTFIFYKLSNTFNIEYSTNLQRINVWKNTLKIIKDYPLGIGIMNFDNVYKNYQSIGEKYLYHAHSWYLQVCLESGIVGFLLLFSSLLTYILSLKDVIIKLALLSFLVFNITDYVLNDNRICFILVILIYLGEKEIEL